MPHENCVYSCVCVVYSLFGNMANEYSSTAQFCGQTEINLGFPISSLSSVSIAHKHTMNHTKVRSTKANVSRFIELSRQISFYRYIILSWQLFSKCLASYHWNVGRIQRHWDITSMCTWVRFRFYQEIYCTIIAQVTSIIISIEFSLVYGIFAFVHINYVIYVMVLAAVAKINKWCISLCNYFVNQKSCYHCATILLIIFVRFWQMRYRIQYGKPVVSICCGVRFVAFCLHPHSTLCVPRTNSIHLEPCMFALYTFKCNSNIIPFWKMH